MDSAKKGDWVQVHQIVLNAGERAPHLPEDTKQVPLELWLKGTILHDAAVGENAEIRTSSGRIVSGRLVSVNPGYTHNYGRFVPELQYIAPGLKEILYGEAGNDK